MHIQVGVAILKKEWKKVSQVEGDIDRVESKGEGRGDIQNITNTVSVR